MRGLFAPSRRAVEATPAQVLATGAWGGMTADPVDGDIGYRRAGASRREVPEWTREKSVVYSIASYRVNPMARAIIDTYTSFVVGDSGVTWQATNPEVGQVVREFWDDPRNNIGGTQTLALRSQMLYGERLLEMLVGKQSGVVRVVPYDPSSICGVTLRYGNANWPLKVQVGDPEAPDSRREFTVVDVDDSTGLRTGEMQLWRPWRAVDTDVRSMPFLMPVLDWLDNYDTVLSNLMDRTALARYLVWDVTIKGDQTDVDNFVKNRKGLHVPPSGSVEAHNESVSWEAKTVATGAEEDSVAAKAALTLIAGGSGLAKTWLADPEDSNRATSLTMAEPVRRRVGAVQRDWLGYQSELVRFAVDRAVASRRLRPTVEGTDPRTGERFELAAAQCVNVTGPEVAAADAQLNAQVLLNLSTGLQNFVDAKILSPEAARIAARKAWEGYVGIPYRAELDSPEANPDDVATHIDDAETKAKKQPALRAVQ